MAIAYFCKNTSFDLDGREYQLNLEITKGLWQAQEVRTGRIHEFNIQELQRCYADGKLVFTKDKSEVMNQEAARGNMPVRINRQLEGQAWDKAKIKRMYAKAIEHLPSTEGIVKQAVREVWEKIRLPEKAPHWVSVCSWKKKYLANGKDAFALGEQHQRKGNRTSRYPLEVIDIAEDCIDRIYLQRERKTIAEPKLLKLQRTGLILMFLIFTVCNWRTAIPPRITSFSKSRMTFWKKPSVYSLYEPNTTLNRTCAESRAGRRLAPR